MENIKSILTSTSCDKLVYLLNHDVQFGLEYVEPPVNLLCDMIIHIQIQLIFK